MFGEKLIIGKHIGKIDSKGRIALPSFTYASYKDTIVLETLNLNNELTLRFSLYNDYLFLAEALNEKRKKATSIEEFDLITEQINTICKRLSCCQELDAQRRFNIPSLILKENELAPGDEMIIEGSGTSVLMRKKK